MKNPLLTTDGKIKKAFVCIDGKDYEFNAYKGRSSNLSETKEVLLVEFINEITRTKSTIELFDTETLIEAIQNLK